MIGCCRVKLDTKTPPDVTGSSSAKTGIFVIYDIFGFFPQTLQGADILANGDKEKSHQVFIPDFFEGNPADISWYPPDNEEKGKKLGAFFSGPAAPPKILSRIPKVLDVLKKEYPNIYSWVRTPRASYSGELTATGDHWLLLGRKGRFERFIDDATAKSYLDFGPFDARRNPVQSSCYDSSCYGRSKGCTKGHSPISSSPIRG